MRHSQNLNDERNKRRDRLNSVPEGIPSNQFDVQYGYSDAFLFRISTFNFLLTLCIEIFLRLVTKSGEKYFIL